MPGHGKRRRHIHGKQFTTVTATAFANWAENGIVVTSSGNYTLTLTLTDNTGPRGQLTTAHSLARAPAGRSRGASFLATRPTNLSIRRKQARYVSGLALCGSAMSDCRSPPWARLERTKILRLRLGKRRANSAACVCSKHKTKSTF